jgi:2-dehydro-3-deoxyglucarate aldolase/4-hydroxy-2-oxoheptanedioate aldolase
VQRANRTRRILEDGGVALGVMIFEMATPGVGRLAASAGADFVLFDLEHTAWSIDRVAPALAAMRADDVTPLVRVPGAVPHLISGALDAGALGVMVPMVDDEVQAAEVVRAATFPPNGRRGYGLLYRDQLHPDGVGATMAASDGERLVIVQIETVRGLEHVDAIAATPGVDVLWVGQYDLSASLGVPGTFDDPRMREAEDRVAAACREHGRAVGMLASGPAHVNDLLERGFRCVAVTNDLRLFDGGLSEALEGARQPGVGPA